MAKVDERLAIEGGTPVRTQPLDYERGLGYIDEEEKRAVLEVLESRSLFRYYGPRLLRRVEQFELAFSSLVGARHALAVSSGTAALRVGLAALDVGPGDEVVLPAVTFIASANAVVAQGAVPVFAEVGPDLTLDPASLEQAIGPRTKAIMPVHLMGVPCRMDQIMETARRRSLAVLEDCAQACGATYLGRPVGRWGHMGAFSFQLEKNITSGEGGCLITDDSDLFARASKYQDQGGQFTLGTGGTRERPGEPLLGENLRLNEIAGAIMLVQLRRLGEIRRRSQAMRDRVLAGLATMGAITLRPTTDADGEVPVVVGLYREDAAWFARALTAEGVPARLVYGGKPVYANPGLLHQRTISSTGRPFTDPLYLARGGAITYRLGMCPRSEDYLRRCVVTGVSPRMSEQDADDIARAIKKVAAGSEGRRGSEGR